MPPKSVTVTLARPNLPYSTLSTNAGIQRLRINDLWTSVWLRMARCVAGSSSQMSEMWYRTKMPSGQGFQIRPRRTDWPPRDFLPLAGQVPSAMRSASFRLSRPRQKRVVASTVSFCSGALASAASLDSQVARTKPWSFFMSTSLSFQVFPSRRQRLGSSSMRIA